MKKVTILAIAVLAVMGTSCKKPRTCTCTYTAYANGLGYSGTSSTYTIVDTKKKASASCEGLSDTYETCTLD